jgi:putative FmdB family regulatory protein
MPRYDYRCNACQTQFEAQHGFADAPPPCPACGSTALKRLITTAPRLMKGMAALASKNASKEELQAKWAEETPKLRQKLRDKLGDAAVNSLPSLNPKSES